METYWTALIELIWGKRRILEVYLNVVEWGRGIYGAGTASEEYFATAPSSLTPEQAAAMAICLPKPLQERPDHLSPESKRRCGPVIESLPLVHYPNP